MVLFAGILFLTGQAAAQEQGDLDTACGQGINSFTCDIISQQVSAGMPAGVYASCVWDGTSCRAIMNVSPDLAEHNTSSESLSAACARGNTNQVICSNISAMIASYAQNPLGVAISCVWNNPGAQNLCSERVVLSTTTITDNMVGDVIKNMSFIQDEITVTQLVVRSDPFIPYYSHVVINGGLFPNGMDAQAWMHVTAVKDITPTEYDFESIDPSALAVAEKEKILSNFQSSGTVDIGPGIGPDFSALKAIQTFTWNISIPYNNSREFAGIANCNGTFNSSVNECQGSGQPSDWISLEECASPGNCPDGTYLKDVPSEGYLTVYGADPVPVYEMSGPTTTTSTTTTSTTTTSTTLAGECTLSGDYAPCGEISLSEVINYINLWADGDSYLSDVISLINAWAE